MIPIVYDSIEVSRDRAADKFHNRAARWPVAFAFVLTGLEALLTLLMLRALRLFRWVTRRGRPALTA